MQGDYLTELSDYGGAKVACEDVYRATSSHTIIRPGLIGGGEDRSGRSGYYPWRFAHPTADDVLVPDPSFSVSLIDIHDLAAWVIECSERGVPSIFNAAGGVTALGEIIELSRDVAGSSAKARVANDDMLAGLGVNPWMGPCASGLSDAEEIEVRRHLAESVP